MSILLAVILTSCSDSETIEYQQLGLKAPSGMELQIIEIDSCEYIFQDYDRVLMRK